MSAESLQEKTLPELEQTLVELLKEQFNLRMQHSTGQLKNTARIKTVRRSIARIKTFINMKGGK
ncbi:50S ribosomal protein L29 [Galenea microaerophila]